MAKSVLRTLRFSPKEMQEIDRYLKQNDSFESISSLGRIAVMEFIHNRRSMALRPLSAFESGQKRPSFLWDYDLTEAQVMEILHHGSFEKRKWLIGRILERLGPPEVFRYLSMEDIQDALPNLRINGRIKEHWKEALEIWMSAPKKF
jgi:hypothetical protein